MKIAVFHNFLDNIGGAEIVCLTLARELNADFYTTNVDEDKITKMGFKSIRLYSIGEIPLNAPFRQQAALRKFRKLDLRGDYDFYIIGGDWAVSAAVNHKPNLWYVHSPIREIWDLYEYTRRHTVPWWGRLIFDAWVYGNRYLNKEYVRHVDTLVCNSANTQQRIKTYLERNARVIYPPIETPRFSYRQNGGFWLSVNRLITHKRVSMQLAAFRKLSDERLVIVGSYEQSRHFRQYARGVQEMKPDNVELMSWVDVRTLTELYANCKGFITTAKDEDFGMTVVEAMASGKPVIAPNEGGYRESVIPGETGILLDSITVDGLVGAIKEVGRAPQSYREACKQQAENFTTSVFVSDIREVIENEF